MNRKRKQIYDELQQIFNLSFVKKEWLEQILISLEKNYSKKKHKSLLKYLETINGLKKELSKDDIIDQLKIENMELYANLDGISLSQSEDKHGNISYAKAYNPYASKSQEELLVLKNKESPGKKYSDDDFKEMTRLALESNIKKAAPKVIDNFKKKNPFIPASVNGFIKMWHKSEHYYYFVNKKNRN